MFQKTERIDEFIIFLNKIMSAWERYEKNQNRNAYIIKSEKKVIHHNKKRK